MNANGLLTVRAGAGALERLRSGGPLCDQVSTLIGASGGPRWLVLSQMDRVLAEQVICDRGEPLDAIGSSIGAFRHACLAQADPAAAIARLEEAYIAQAYGDAPDADEVTQASRGIVETVLGGSGAAEILDSPLVTSHVVATRLRYGRHDRGWRFRVGFAAAAVGNAITRKSLSLCFERALFSSRASETPGFADMTTHRVPLSKENLADALLASGSIPFVMRAIENVAGAPPGLYLDGGILDYHFDFRFARRPGITLFPHFFDYVVPGWLDKSLAWRRVDPALLSDVLLIAPSEAFVRGLPGGRVPDRNDFQRLSTPLRQKAWREIVDRCRALADALHDLISTSRIAEVAQGFR